MPERPDPNAVHLHAAILYLRPQLRPPLLSGLAELGIFLCEHTDAESLVRSHESRPVDVLVMVVEDNPTHAGVASALAERLSAAVVAVLPAGASTSRFTAASSVTTQDDELWEHFSAVIAPAAAEARDRRSGGKETVLGCAGICPPYQAQMQCVQHVLAPFYGLLLTSKEACRRALIRSWTRAFDRESRQALSAARRLRLACIGAISTWNLGLWGTLALSLVGR